MLKLQGGAADQGGNDSEMNEELRELKDENEKLRRSLALLHTYSLKLHKHCETLAAQSDRLLDECEAAAVLLCGDDYPRSLLVHPYLSYENHSRVNNAKIVLPFSIPRRIIKGI